ncbi:MAG TPA: dNTP triphosphohydrolase [Conexibacter sp.]|nr:dNTP triphosphohydrolase [Conexibacter sp.]
MERQLTPLTDERRAGLTARESDADSTGTSNPDYRTPQQRDRDRILYSSAFQRLAYVTQVTAPEAGHTFHNRLSHSLKVAQVGRRNAERLRALAAKGEITGAAATLVEALDPEAVEASCLAHDLGHPPFGHIAETVLNELGGEHLQGGFEGNAQSFRIVTRLAVRTARPGLDLTRETLDGLLKYPWAHRSSDPVHNHKREHKWGYYAQDAGSFDFARAGWPAETEEELPERCLGAELMDWADDVTYAVHDVDDFFRAGLVPLDRLAHPQDSERKRLVSLLKEARASDREPWSYEIDELVAAAERALRHGPIAPYEHTTTARIELRRFASRLITNYLDAFTVRDDPATGAAILNIDDEARLQVAALKLLVRVYVIQHPGLAVIQHGQQRVVRELYDCYFRASNPAPGKGDRRLFPPTTRERLDSEPGDAASRARVILDLIAGLTETSAIQLHRRLCGGETAVALDHTALIG